MVFSIDAAVFEALPELCVGVVTAVGIDNTAGSVPAIDRLLDEAVADAGRRLAGIHASDDLRVQPYRQAFHALGMSPSRYPSSNIALLRRIAKGKGVWRVNPVVDLGNAISIKYALPLGAHALGPGETLELRLSRPGDVFVELGEKDADPTLAPGELVYAVGNLVHTRRWTWRQSENGKVDAGTTRAVFPIDGFLGINDDAVRAACDELAARLRDDLGARTSVALASAAAPQV
ncbi:B3/B4 domain-containing protein [Thermophilibacter sp.]